MTTTEKNHPAAVAGLVFLFALICFLPLPAGAPLAGTEGHRAMTAHQMVESGEWVVPRLFGRIYIAKPPLHYWIIGMFEKLSGRATPFIWRLPSAVEGAITAALLSLFAGRWFGRIAGWVSGVSFVALITLWGENRGADIDVTNTLAANLAAMCLLELHFGAGCRRWPWILIAGLATGASLLVKGPAGMTIILGMLLWAIIVAISKREYSSLRRHRFWLPIVLGLAILAIWVGLALRYLKSHGLPVDQSGWREGTQDLHPHDWNWKRAREWVLLPATLFAFTLPVSLALPWAMFRGVTREKYRGFGCFREAFQNLTRGIPGEDARQSRLIGGLSASVLLAWLICFISGMHLPRYAYVTLPLLCPLAGALASRVPRMDRKAVWWVRVILSWTAVAYAAAAIVISVMLALHPELPPLLIAVAILAVGTAFLTARMLHQRENWKALWGIPVLLLLLSIAMGSFHYYDRLARSSVGPAQMIREKVGPNAELVTCMMVLDQPELFYYTGLPTRATNEAKLDWHPLKLGTWVVLEKPELEQWQAEIPQRLREVIPFVANKDNKGYLVLYAQKAG